jgi:monofunctional biosynthetic peptidoglycan transglycosylase
MNWKKYATRLKYFVWFFIASYIYLWCHKYVILPVYFIHQMSDHYLARREIELGTIAGLFVNRRFSLESTKPKNWVSYSQISTYQKAAIVSSEDQRFYTHSGFDFEQIEEAIKDSVIKHKKWRGASTITQQLIKNAFLTKDKTLWRKINEFFLATYIEKVLDKKKIFEHYLNIIEYGENLYGINDAARKYFKKSAQGLNPREAAFIAMLLPNPVKFSVSHKRHSLTGFAKRRIVHILRKMAISGKISQDQYYSYANSAFFWEYNPSPLVEIPKPVESSTDENEPDDDEIEVLQGQIVPN